jgi:hypothetical protein
MGETTMSTMRAGMTTKKLQQYPQHIEIGFEVSDQQSVMIPGSRHCDICMARRRGFFFSKEDYTTMARSMRTLTILEDAPIEKIIFTMASVQIGGSQIASMMGGHANVSHAGKFDFKRP